MTTNRPWTWPSSAHTAGSVIADTDTLERYLAQPFDYVITVWIRHAWPR